MIFITAELRVRPEHGEDDWSLLGELEVRPG